MRIRSQLLFVKVLLFTPFTVTRFAMHRNHAFAWFRAAILGFSVNFVHKKRLAERYQWTVTSRCHFLITPDTTFLRIRKREAEAPQLYILLLTFNAIIAMIFSIGGSFPSGATAFPKATASGSALFIAFRTANCISVHKKVSSTLQLPCPQSWGDRGFFFSTFHS